MKSHKLLVTLSFSLLLSGCDRPSEKDKMEMIAKCDSEARKKLQEKSVSEYGGSGSITVETHYSFEDKQCYALQKISVSVERNAFQNQEAQTLYGETLYDGLTKKQLLTASCLKKNLQLKFPEVQKLSEACIEGRICFGYEDDDCRVLRSGGSASGLLESQANKKDGEVVTYEEGKKIIDARMNRP